MPTDFWLMMLWRQEKVEKIKEALATEGLLKPQLEQQILRSENLRKKIRIQEAIKEREERVDEQIVPFVPIDSVEEWKKSFLEFDFYLSLVPVHSHHFVFCFVNPICQDQS